MIVPGFEVRKAEGKRLYAWEKRGASLYHLCVRDGVPVCGFTWKHSRAAAGYGTINENTLGSGKKAVCWKCVDAAVNGLSESVSLWFDR